MDTKLTMTQETMHIHLHGLLASTLAKYIKGCIAQGLPIDGITHEIISKVGDVLEEYEDECSF